MKTRKKMDDTLDVTQLVKEVFMTDSGNDPMIGATVRFIIKNAEHAKRMGSLACTCTYEVIGTQRCWGFDEKGHYTMVDGYRLICLDYDDRFGRPANKYEIQVISTLN